MRLCLFEHCDNKLLEPDLSSCDNCYKARISKHADTILSCIRKEPDKQSIIDVPRVKLDSVASVHCDKWLEETGLHMDLYASASQAPYLVQGTSDHAILGKFPALRHKSFSGDMSGTIGEALFSLVLMERFGLSDADFVHFGASKSTGVFPDFGIHSISQELQRAFDRHSILSPNLMQTHLIPAEVKAMANPDSRIVKERFDKAVQQIRNFWCTRKLKLADGQPIKRGASIVFLALRDQYRSAYDGVIVWMG